MLRLPQKTVGIGWIEIWNGQAAAGGVAAECWRHLSLRRLGIPVWPYWNAFGGLHFRLCGRSELRGATIRGLPNRIAGLPQ